MPGEANEVQDTPQVDAPVPAKEAPKAVENLPMTEEALKAALIEKAEALIAEAQANGLHDAGVVLAKYFAKKGASVVGDIAGELIDALSARIFSKSGKK